MMVTFVPDDAGVSHASLIGHRDEAWPESTCSRAKEAGPGRVALSCALYAGLYTHTSMSYIMMNLADSLLTTQVRAKMLQASSRAGLMKALGASNFKHDWFATSVVRHMFPPKSLYPLTIRKI